MQKNGKVPLDIKVVSIILLLSSFTYFGVNTSIFHLYGKTLSGLGAEVLWLLSCFICLACAYGFWKGKLLFWKIMIGYSIFYLGNLIVNFILLSHADRAAIAKEPVPIGHDYSSSTGFFVFFLTGYVCLILYLLKRRKVFDHS
jgi:hypothetical protein